MISAVAQKYNIHPQTLRLYEREGLLKPSRTEGNTRLYSEEDLEQLETILSLTRDLGVNLAGVEIILNMRRKIEAMQHEVNEFMDYVKRELSRGIGDWEQRLSTALVKSSPTDLVRQRRHRRHQLPKLNRSKTQRTLKRDCSKSEPSVEVRAFSVQRLQFSIAHVCPSATTPAGSRSTVDGVRRVVRCDCWQSEHTRAAVRRRAHPAALSPLRPRQLPVYPNEKLINAVPQAQRFAEQFPAVAKGPLPDRPARRSARRTSRSRCCDGALARGQRRAVLRSLAICCA